MAFRLSASLKKKYALSDKGVRSVYQGTLWTAAVNVVVMAGAAALYLAVDALVNTLTQGAGLPGVGDFALGLTVFVVALFACTWFQYHYTYNVFYEESGKQRIEIAERLRKLPLSFFGRRDLADLTSTVLSDVQVMEHAYSHALAVLYGAVLSSVVVFIGCMCFSWQLAIASFWSIPVAFALLCATRKPMAPIMEHVRQTAVETSDHIQETLDCVREIRASNHEEAYLQGLHATIDASEAAMRTGELVNGIIVNSAMAVLRLGVATTLLVGANLVVSGQIGFMGLFAFLLVVSRLYNPFDQCLMCLSELFAAATSAKRMHEILDEPIATGSTTFAPSNHDVEFEHVAFSYGAGPDGRAGDKVLADVSFVAKEGQVTALVGPSGSGKSTCARLAARFWDATAGTVRVGGVDVATVDPEVLLRDWAVVFQDVLLFDDTVMGNIRLGRRDATDEEVLAAARAANCDEFVRRLPQGYDTMIGENGGKLSGGERQRISIARALLKDAPMVLLDEATASLDVENESQVQQALSRLLAGKTVIVIAHRMRTVENADKVVVLKDGRVAEQGSPADLLAANGEFARMVALQRESAGWRMG